MPILTNMPRSILTRLAWNAYLAYQMLGQKQAAFLPPGEIRDKQSRRLRSTVRYAFRNVPYYRETMTRLGISPGEIRTVDDLPKLPLIERAQLQRDPEYFLSRAVDRKRCVEVRSSGSSGAPKVLWHDPASLFQNAAHGERERPAMRAALGSWAGYRETVIASPVNPTQKIVQEFVRKAGLFPNGVRIERQYLLLSEPVETSNARMSDYRPDLLYTYGSYMAMLCAYWRRHGRPEHLPKAILYTSDNLPEPDRRWLADECGIPVFSVYGSVEALKMAFSTSLCDGMHVNSDLYPLRIVGPDGRDTGPEEHGEVVVSNLVNRATVLLNYRLGDLAALSPQPCPCGRTLPLILRPTGRVDEIIELADGSILHPVVFRELCLREEGILRFQIEQTAPSAFRISLVIAPGTDGPRLAQSVGARFRNRFGDSATAEICLVDELQRTLAGKTPAVMALRREAR
jgi:phenylacetate-CoA ligase